MYQYFLMSRGTLGKKKTQALAQSIHFPALTATVTYCKIHNCIFHKSNLRGTMRDVKWICNNCNQQYNWKMHRCIFNNGNIRRKIVWRMYNSLIMTTSEGIRGILISKLPGQLGTAGTGVEECRGSVGEPFSWHQVVGLQEKWACYQTHCYQETVKTPGAVSLSVLAL